MQPQKNVINKLTIIGVKNYRLNYPSSKTKETLTHSNLRIDMFRKKVYIFKCCFLLMEGTIILPFWPEELVRYITRFFHRKDKMYKRRKKAAGGLLMSNNRSSTAPQPDFWL